MRALFVGGPVDNSELDLAPGDPPQHYPDKQTAGHAHAQYRLYRVGPRGKRPEYAVYAAREMPDEDVERICDERDYARRFAA